RELLPESILSPSARFATLSSFPLARNTSLFEIIDAFERRVIIEMLEQTGWSQTEAADNFKIPLSTLNQKIKRHGIEIKKKRERPSGVPTTTKKLPILKFVLQLRDRAAKSPKRIVYPESTDPRVLRAAARIVELRIAKPIVVGSPQAVESKARELGINISHIEVVDPKTLSLADRYV